LGGRTVAASDGSLSGCRAPPLEGENDALLPSNVYGESRGISGPSARSRLAQRHFIISLVFWLALVFGFPGFWVAMWRGALAPCGGIP
jgi:hypothetical protein